MIFEALIFLLTFIVIYVWYSYKQTIKYFEDRHVKYLQGWPIFGNLFMTTFQRNHFFDDIDRVYKAFPGEKYVGFMDNMRPQLLIRDPELIKRITVKDFDHFTDHRAFFSSHLEPLFAASLFSIKGEQWRNMRTTLSPAFTGSKMKHMMQFMIDISQNTVEYIKEHKNEAIDVDDIVRRYTNDVIASTNFGLEVNSLKDRNNEFFKTGQSVLSFDFRQTVLMFLDEHFPSLIKNLGLKLYPKKTYDFFINTIMNTVEYRKANNVTRPDMLQLLMDTPIEWTPENLSAQAFIFFAAGFETSASGVVLTLHELALNPEVQEKLYKEIRAFKDANGDISHDNLNSLNYLDCVLNETLRKWSPSVVIDRKCVKAYELPDACDRKGHTLLVQPGEVVLNSSNSLHMDPEYWPEPHKYDPDRWSDENKHKIKPFTYMPFGSGPRICIGMRFAILEIKILLYYLVLNFKITKCSKTSDPIKLINYGFLIQALGGTWLKFEERS